MASRDKSRNVGWSTAAEDLLAYYRAYGTRDPEEASSRVRQLTAYFKGWRLADIDASAVLGYVNYRKGQGRANATINADLAVLRKLLRVAQELAMLDVVPRIRMLRPAPPRAGFFEEAQFERVVSALPLDLALVAASASNRFVSAGPEHVEGRAVRGCSGMTCAARLAGTCSALEGGREWLCRSWAIKPAPCLTAMAS